MVKFGRHLQFYLESDELQQSDGGNEDPYIVPYTDIRESIGHSQHQFVQEWTSSLKLASDDYTRRLKFLWKRIFDDVFSSSSALTRHHKSNGNPFVNNDVHDDFGFATKFEEEHRGLPNDRAIQLYVTTMEEIRSIELFAYMKKLHSAAAMNGEALRKLVKKFDKGALARGDDLLTSAMFPDLYSASFMSYRSLDNYIGMMRDTLGVSEEDEETTAEDENEDTLNSFQRKHRNDDVVIQGRSDELSWLHNTLARLPYLMLTSLVAHRGFHCPRDGSYRRPLKNSLAAFESAWCSGIYLCDCDIALTKDEKLVLANNDDFSVGDLTMKEIISLTFKSGSRPPLLIDVLRSAQAIGGKSKLVIEIKPGNPEACTALVRLFRLHPDLICRCAAVMSFDAWAMHKLRAELDELASSLKVSRSPSTPSLCVLEQNPPEGINDFQCVPDSTSFQLQMPEILLLTVANEPRQHYELWVDVSDFSPVYSWLSNGNKSSLDGVYLQFQHEMLDPSGISAMRELSKKYRIGVWGEFGHDPDNCITATQLIRECGVSFVNSDLPRGFMGSNAHFGA